MKWNKCFEKYHYSSLIEQETDGSRKLLIPMFEEDGQIPAELEEVYLSALTDELIVIIRLKEEMNVADVCAKWDSRIMAFINFGHLPGENNGKEHMRKIRYNVVQILLNEHEVDKRLEKDTSISRKIFLRCGEDNELDSDNRLLLPFWYDEFDSIIIDPEREAKLKELLPVGEETDFLRKSRVKIRKKKNSNEEQLNFSKEESDVLKGWLETDETEEDNN